MNLNIKPFTYWVDEERETWCGPVIRSRLRVSFFGAEVAAPRINPGADPEEALAFFVSSLFQLASESTEDMFHD